MKSPLSLLFSRLNKPSSLSLSWVLPWHPLCEDPPVTQAQPTAGKAVGAQLNVLTHRKKVLTIPHTHTPPSEETPRSQAPETPCPALSEPQRTAQPARPAAGSVPLHPRATGHRPRDRPCSCHRECRSKQLAQHPSWDQTGSAQSCTAPAKLQLSPLKGAFLNSY